MLATGGRAGDGPLVQWQKRQGPGGRAEAFQEVVAGGPLLHSQTASAPAAARGLGVTGASPGNPTPFGKNKGAREDR
jgi:hypothetical protein